MCLGTGTADLRAGLGREGGLSLGVKKGEGQIKKIRGGNVNIVDDEIVGFKTSVGGIARRLLAISRVLGTEG